MPGPTGSTASSTIASPVGSQAAPTILTRSARELQQLFFDTEQIRSPENLQRILSQAFGFIASAIAALSTDPAASGNILTGVVFGAGQTRTLNHGLGRAYRGWYCVRAQGGAAALVEAVLPVGVPETLCLAITSTNAGTFAIKVF